MLWLKFKSPSYSTTWPDIISSGNTLKFLNHKHDKDDGNFSGSSKKTSITMTTAWRCAPCQQMRRIQIQWSGCWACNLLAKIEFIRCGWLRWREWGCVGLAAPRQIVWPLREQTRVRKYLPAVTAMKICALLPGAMLTSKSGERLGRNLGCRNYNSDMNDKFWCWYTGSSSDDRKSLRKSTHFRIALTLACVAESCRAQHIWEKPAWVNIGCPKGTPNHSQSNLSRKIL